MPVFLGHGGWTFTATLIDPEGVADPVVLEVLEVTIRRGISSYGWRFSAGSAQLVLDNTEGLYSSSSPNFIGPLWRSGAYLEVLASRAGVDERLFFGSVDDSPNMYADAGFNLTAQLAATDFMAWWNQFDPPALDTPTGTQRSDLRVEAALDRAGWPAGDRDIQVGTHFVQSSHLAQPTLLECQMAAEAEGGAFFCDRTGQAVFKARDWLVADARSTEIQAEIGDHFPILEVGETRSKQRVVNSVSFARVGGSVQVAEDVTSQAQLGPRTYRRHDLRNATNDAVALLAERWLMRYSSDRPILSGVTVSPDWFDDAASNEWLVVAEFGDRVAVSFDTHGGDGWHVAGEYQLFGISHRITADDWSVRLSLDAPETYWPPGLGIIAAWPSTVASIPAGWERVTSFDDRFPWGHENVGTPGWTSGAATHTHAQQPHRHGIADHTHTHGGLSGNSSSSIIRNESSTPPSVMAQQAHGHVISTTHGVSGSPQSGSNTVGMGTATNLVTRREVLFVARDGELTSVPVGMVGYWVAGDSPPSGWDDWSAGADTYLRGAAPAANGSASTLTTGAHSHSGNSHTHTGVNHHHGIVPISTGVGSGNQIYFAGALVGGITLGHGHSVQTQSSSTGTLQSASTGTSGETNPGHLEFYRAKMIIKTGTPAAPPAGLILMWPQSVDLIPPGWIWCNGDHGTPDLRGKWLRYASNGTIGQTGGSRDRRHTHSMSTHFHTTPGHTHGVSFSAPGGSAASNAQGGGEPFPYSGYQHTHTAGPTASSSPNSTATAPIANEASARPPSITTHYIMKLP